MTSTLSPSSTTLQLVEAMAARLDAAGVSFGHGTTNAFDEAAWLVLWQLGHPLHALDEVADDAVTPEAAAQVEALVQRRIDSRRPAAYLTGEAWLQGVPFHVDERVIVPRSFIAELLDEQLAPWVDDPWAIEHALDLCTGSGCLAIKLALNFPNAQVDAVDLSPDALIVAERNIADYQLGERIHPVLSDAFTALAGKRYDLIISNPPYVDAKAVAALPPEYRHEPEMALGSGTDGLDFTRIILREAKKHLTEQGLLIVEIGHNRAALEAAFPTLPFTWLETAAGDEYVFMLQAADLPATI